MEVGYQPATWQWLGQLSHGDAYARQLDAHARVLAGGPGEILLCEHPPVITMGRAADAGNVLATREELARRRVDVIQTSRGGDVTYHGPGQLMVYPVVQLGTSLREFLHTVADAFIEYAESLGVTGLRFATDPAGVWYGEAKMGACGLHIQHRIVTHGFAFDIATPKTAWSFIRPCGLNAPNKSLGEVCDALRIPQPNVQAVALALGPRLAETLRRPPL